MSSSGDKGNISSKGARTTCLRGSSANRGASKRPGEKSKILSMDQLVLQKGKRKKCVVAHPKGSHISKYIDSAHDKWQVMDTNSKASKDSNFTLGLHRECDKAKNSISPTIHPDSTLERNPLQLALAHTNVTGRHYWRNAKEIRGKKRGKRQNNQHAHTRRWLESHKDENEQGIQLQSLLRKIHQCQHQI